MFRISLCAVAMLLPALAAQEPPKKRVLTHADQDIWSTATGITLSPDGKFLAYTQAPTVGEATFIVKNVATGTEFKFYAGTRTAQAAAAPAGDGGENEESEGDQLPPGFPGAGGGGGPGAGGPTFTPDSKFLYFSLQPAKADVEKAKTDKKLPSQFPRPVLAVLDLASGQIVKKHEKVRAFSILGDGAGILVRTMEPPPEEKKGDEKKEEKKEIAPMPKGGEPKAEPKKDVAFIPAARVDADAAPDQKGKGGRQGGTGTQPGQTPRPQTGSDVVVTDLAGGREVTFNDVVTYSITRDLKNIAFTVGAKVPARAGVYFSPLSMPTPTTVLAGPGRYYQLTWDEKQTKLAFFFDENAAAPAPPATPNPANPAVQPPPVDPATLGRKPKVYLWDRTTQSPAVEVAGPSLTGLKKGWQIVDRGGLGFSADGLKLSLAAAPMPEPPVTKEAAKGTTDDANGDQSIRPTLPARDPSKVEMDLWHWKDEAIQPMQAKQANADRTRSYRAVYFLDTKQFKHLADEDRSVTVPDYGDWGVGVSNKKYRGRTWEYSDLPSDYALVNVRTGEAKPVATALKGGLSASPKGKYLIGFDGKNWYAVTAADGKRTVLTAKLGVNLFNEQFDSPMTVPPYGLAGWGTDEKSVYVYDQFDLWRVSADGSEPAAKLTDGRASGTRFRLARVEKPEDPNAEAERERGLNPAFPWLLTAENQTTRDTGFVRLTPDGKTKQLVMGARKYGNPAKAKKADVYTFTVQTFSQYPDYYVADADFTEIKRVTDINPRVKEFNWGTSELVSFKTTDGEPLQAVLVKPEDFDPNKKYPMIVYIYERLTNTVHNFRAPTAGTSINPTFYASNGYLVLMPDIAYEVGHPGPSAMKCVLPAIQAVADKGFLNETAVGIQGHSWGGYQIAYMVTQTNRFKAAVAGAPVSNMISAYNGIRWQTGLPRQFQYEHTQSRIGGTPWEMPMRYLENSPVFAADRVRTPLVILHNDQDGAVPWYQGIEYYLALRRLGRECYLFNYNGEPHGLTKKSNQRDYTLRMHQFFDHHLKGAPMPAWMEKGVPFLERDKEKEQWKKLFEPAK